MSPPGPCEWVGLTQVQDAVDTQKETRPEVKCSPWGWGGSEKEQVREGEERKKKELPFGYTECHVSAERSRGSVGLELKSKVKRPVSRLWLNKGSHGGGRAEGDEDEPRVTRMNKTNSRRCRLLWGRRDTGPGEKCHQKTITRLYRDNKDCLLYTRVQIATSFTWDYHRQQDRSSSLNTSESQSTHLCGGDKNNHLASQRCCKD